MDCSTPGSLSIIITNSVNMNLSKLLEIVKDRGAWRAAVHGVTKSVHGIFQARILERVVIPWGIFLIQGSNLSLFHLLQWQGGFFTTGTTSRVDLSDPGILHCRQILYQLSYQGSPREEYKRL